MLHLKMQYFANEGGGGKATSVLFHRKKEVIGKVSKE